MNYTVEVKNEHGKWQRVRDYLDLDEAIADAVKAEKEGGLKTRIKNGHAVIWK